MFKKLNEFEHMRNVELKMIPQDIITIIFTYVGRNGLPFFNICVATKNEQQQFDLIKKYINYNSYHLYVGISQYIDNKINNSYKLFEYIDNITIINCFGTNCGVSILGPLNLNFYCKSCSRTDIKITKDIIIDCKGTMYDTKQHDCRSTTYNSTHGLYHCITCFPDITTYICGTYPKIIDILWNKHVLKKQMLL